MPPLRTLAPLAALVFAAGCTVGPDYHPPRPALPDTFSALHPAPPAPADGSPIPGASAVEHWWLAFRDPVLNRLVDRAVAGNRDLQLAASRVRQARLQRSVIYAGALPSLDLAAGVNRGRGSENITLPFGGGGGGAAPTAAPERRVDAPSTGSGDTSSSGSSTAPAASTGGRPAGPTSPLGEGGLPGLTTTLYQAGFDAAWEIDLFGGTRRAIEVGDALVQGAEESRRGVEVSLLAEVAESYVQLRSAQQRLRLAREGLDAARQTLGLAEARLRHGFATDLEVAQHTAEVATASAVLPPLEAAERLAIHALSVLVGEAPAALADELSAPASLPALPPEIPVGVPSDLLRRRPDIRAAERQLAAATAQVGVATADLFPHFSLTGAFGFDSSRLGDLPQWSSHYYSIIPGVRWPLLDWGRARTAVRLQNESQAQALTRYEAAVSQALKEVEDALVRTHAERRRHAALLEAESAARRSFTLAQHRFEHGLVDSLVVLDAERSLLQSQDARAQSDATLRSDLIALYKALGGGWETETPAAASASTPFRG